MMASGRKEATALAMQWTNIALLNFWASDKIRAVVASQASIFLLMGYDSTELRMTSDEHGFDVVPASATQ